MQPQGAMAASVQWRTCCSCSHSHQTQQTARPHGGVLARARPSQPAWRQAAAPRSRGHARLRFDPLRLGRCGSSATGAAPSGGFDPEQARSSSTGASSASSSGSGGSKSPPSAVPKPLADESEALPEGFCLIESRDSVKNFATMQLSEIETNIVARRNRIFLLMEEVRRLRIQRRLKGAEEQQGSDWVPEEKFASAIPWLPPITEDTIAAYWRVYLATVAFIIVFGGLLSPILEVRLGVGGQTYSEFISSMHLPAQLAAVDPIVASFCGGAVGVLSTLMVVEANNADQQAKRRCFYCQGSGYLTCGACVGSGSGEDGGGCNLCSGTGKVMCTACLCTGKQMATEHDPRIDPFD